MRCLACHTTFYEQPIWRKLLMLESTTKLCPPCESKLTPIHGNRCSSCSRSLDSLTPAFKKGNQCSDCLRWARRSDIVHVLERNVSLYEYNAFLKEWFATFKFRGDAVIAFFFAEKLAEVYEREFCGYLPVALPLSQERLIARGFNQSRLLMQGWADDPAILFRTSGEKQSKKNRKQRIKQLHQNPFSIRKDADVSQKNIVLIDDIYTTGTSVRLAASVLKENGAKKVASLTVAR
ncbi:ComF family protein [Halalkalibacter kiskunsagensis]|uniref:ComF family protein n=1 Tax=Halalkalibacter kiskunsagensis TaxID=1548599 RepID=A0ABV6KAJ8_9BACI